MSAATDLILAGIAALAFGWFVAFGILGWVVPRRDDSTRSTYRYFAWGGIALNNMTRVVPWDGWMSAVSLIVAAYALWKVEDHWRDAERRRRIERGWVR